MNKLLTEKFSKDYGPKRILALDGGGVRGALTLGYLEKIEQLLRARFKNENLVLADYYDLIGGTSTGAIISACLAIGKPVKDVVALYQNLGKEVFGKRRYPIIPRSWTTFRAFFTSTYKGTIIEELLKNNLGEIGLCDYEKLRSPVTIISKRADTFSLWTVANHPDGIFTKAMSHLKLWELCRASSAAPYYFPPKKLSLRTRKGESFDAAFIDGGVSLANNPAFQLFLTSTIPSFGFKWHPGEKNIFITSLGTGNGVNKDSVKDIVSRKTVSWSSKLPDLFMTDALEMNEVMMQILGRNYGDAEIVDSQYNDFTDTSYSKDKLFSFVRFNVKLTGKYLKEKLSIEKNDDEVSSIIQMDHYENIDALLNIGRHGAAYLNDSHLPSEFD